MVSNIQRTMNVPVRKTTITSAQCTQPEMQQQNKNT
jgi:hypothetical protein